MNPGPASSRFRKLVTSHFCLLFLLIDGPTVVFSKQDHGGNDEQDVGLDQPTETREVTLPGQVKITERRNEQDENESRGQGDPTTDEKGYCGMNILQ